MAHFAEIDENNIVLQVVVINDAYMIGMDLNENEDQGVKFCQQYISPNRWVQTSYNWNKRGRFAGIGYTYDEEADQFVPPQPYPSWSYNYTTYFWEAPVAYPDDGKNYDWDEQSIQWIASPNQMTISAG